MQQPSTNRINVGCGATPTPGWLNLDNSPTVRFAGAARLVSRLPGMRARTRFLQTAHDAGIRWASATSLPVADASADVVYSSHMLEHLDREQAEQFLREAYRVLRPQGVLRLVLPDLRILIKAYLDEGDADSLVERTLLSIPPARTWLDRWRLGVVGHRGHAWMYDGASLSKLVSRCGFSDVRVVAAGETRIQNPAPLDLQERAGESVYVEATR